MVRDAPTDEWKPALRNLCNPAPYEECDCGYIGEWEHRWWYEWHEDSSGKKRADWLIRRDTTLGLPARAGDSGHWIMGGFDERCHGCGDIERFDLEANPLDRWHGEDARVVSLTARRRQDGNT